MILEAFSQHLKQQDDKISADIILLQWLREKLKVEPEDNTDRILHAEIEFSSDENGNIIFKGKAKSGKILLEALFNYAQSYEQQKFGRWVHKLKASDFPK